MKTRELFIWTVVVLIALRTITWYAFHWRWPEWKAPWYIAYSPLVALGVYWTYLYLRKIKRPSKQS